MNALILKKKTVVSVDCIDESDVWAYLSNLTPEADPQYNLIELFYGFYLIYNDGVLEPKSFKNKFVKNLLGERINSNCALVKFDYDWNLVDFTEDDIYVLCRMMKYEVDV